MLLQGNIVRAFQPDDVVALDPVPAVAASLGILQELEPEFDSGCSQSLNVSDLCLDMREVGHGNSLSV